MYTNVSDDFKNAVKSNAIVAAAQIYFPSLDLWIKSDKYENFNSSLVDLTIKDNCCDSGRLFGTAITKEAEVNIINKDNLDLADQEFELFVGVRLPDETYEFVPYGNFIVTSYEDTKSNNVYKIIAYDYMSKLNISFRDIVGFEPTYPITLKEFKEELLTTLNISFADQTLPNDDFVIRGALELSGYSARAVLGYIAELQGCFVKIDRNNTLQFFSINETQEQIDAYSMNSKLEVDNVYGPINVVSLTMKGVEGENVTLRDEESIALYGENTIEFPDNPFVWSQELREEAINDLFDAVKGFTYIPTKFNYKARMYLDCGDTIQVYDVQNQDYVNSIVLNQTIKIPATRQSTMENIALTKTQIAYQYISKTEQVGYHTEFKVDKQNQQISTIVQQIGDRTGKQTSITQDLDNIVFSVQNSGGNNLIKNSVMFDHGVDDNQQVIASSWEISGEGTITPTISPDATNNGSLSGHVFILDDMLCKQKIMVKPDNPLEATRTYYTFSTKLKKNATGTCYVKIYNENEEYYVVQRAAGESDNYKEYALEKILPTMNYYWIEFYGSSSSGATFTDNMFSIGEYKTPWTQASGEIMSALVKVNSDGMTVKSSQNEGDYTKITPAEFAGYSTVNGQLQRVFSLNKDTTEMEKIEVRKQIDMSPIKIVPSKTSAYKGWAWVKTE